MITVWGEGRGFRIVWLLEEMGLPYRLRGVDRQVADERLFGQLPDERAAFHRASRKNRPAVQQSHAGPKKMPAAANGRSSRQEGTAQPCY